MIMILVFSLLIMMLSITYLLLMLHLALFESMFSLSIKPILDNKLHFKYSFLTLFISYLFVLAHNEVQNISMLSKMTLVLLLIFYKRSSIYSMIKYLLKQNEDQRHLIRKTNT